MSKYAIKRTAKFRKDYKRLKKRGYDMSLLEAVVKKLANGIPLPPQYRDHKMHGDKRGYRNCHVLNDWVLLYKIEKNILTLILAETGTHSDILE